MRITLKGFRKLFIPTTTRASVLGLFLVFPGGLLLSASTMAEERRALFGDLHVHTQYSFDAYLFGTRTSPDDAYKFAKGGAIPHPGGTMLQLDRPLDFYAVTDHGFYLGMWHAIAQEGHPFNQDPDARAFLDAKGVVAQRNAFQTAGVWLRDKGINPEDMRTAWQDIQAAAERHNNPGEFTTFVAYEYTAVRDGNLHRNVIYRGDDAPDLPFSRSDSQNPEDLWNWMDKHRELGREAMAIPHNSNGSNGNMFQMTTFDGSPLTPSYAEQRMRNEPLVEITQIKGTSDTHPFLSPNDEWSDFEIFPYQVARWTKSRPQGSYAREAWLNGFKLEAQGLGNPYLFGVIGSSDTHNSGEQFDESKFLSKVGSLDSDPVNRGSIPASIENGLPAFIEVYNRFFSASGLAGAWAPENTRGAIYDAFRRRETFATSGTRMQVRFFGGYGLDKKAIDDAGYIDHAYRRGVPMGGDLFGKKRGAPSFFVWASQDPLGVKLQRLQVIKGWMEDGQAKEQVYDVACADGLQVDPKTHRCPDNGATVELSTCKVSANLGAAELKTRWQDPNFDKHQRAFYYVRALENPTCRWSTWDAVRNGSAPRPDLQTTIQERAWSSPIWYAPPKA